MRRDAWWTQPLFVFLGLSTFIVYSTWAAFQGTHYWLDQNGADYLSPFYSPEIFGNSPHAIFGGKAGLVAILAIILAGLSGSLGAGRLSPDLLLLPRRLLQSVLGRPACVRGRRTAKRISGRNSFPLIMQNIHRYFLYIALLFILVLAHDAWKAMWFSDGSGAKHFGIGVGTIVLTINVFLLGSYTFGCHSLRHLIGGFLDEVSKVPVCARSYACVSCLNRRHMLCAWMSLFWVGFSDLYVRLCSMGLWHDWKIL